MSTQQISPNDVALRQNLARLLERYAAHSYRVQRNQHTRAGRSPRTFCFSPDGFHRAAVTTLGRGTSYDVSGLILSPEFDRYR